jgi:hypothetical protein
MAKTGLFHPAGPLWVANGLMGVVSMFLFRRMLRY